MARVAEAASYRVMYDSERPWGSERMRNCALLSARVRLSDTAKSPKPCGCFMQEGRRVGGVVGLECVECSTNTAN